jgi:hypothetical protein
LPALGEKLDVAALDVLQRGVSGSALLGFELLDLVIGEQDRLRELS